MKSKKQKAGRPKVDDKKVLYTFTVLDSVKDAALNNFPKEDLDIELRLKLDKAAKYKKK